jgi:hypothetical protein
MIEGEPRLSDYKPINQKDLDYMLFLLYGLVPEETAAVEGTDSECAAEDTACTEAASAAAEAKIIQDAGCEAEDKICADDAIATAAEAATACEADGTTCQDGTSASENRRLSRFLQDAPSNITSNSTELSFEPIYDTQAVTYSNFTWVIRNLTYDTIDL